MKRIKKDILWAGLVGVLLFLGAGCGAQIQEVIVEPEVSIEFNTVDVAIFYNNGTKRRMNTDSVSTTIEKYKDKLIVKSEEVRQYTILGVVPGYEHILLTLDQYKDTVSFIYAPVRLTRQNGDTLEHTQTKGIYEVKKMAPELVALGGQLAIIYYTID